MLTRRPYLFYLRYVAVCILFSIVDCVDKQPYFSTTANNQLVIHNKTDTRSLSLHRQQTHHAANLTSISNGFAPCRESWADDHCDHMLQTSMCREALAYADAYERYRMNGIVYIAGASVNSTSTFLSSLVEAANLARVLQLALIFDFGNFVHLQAMLEFALPQESQDLYSLKANKIEFTDRKGYIQLSPLNLIKGKHTDKAISKFASSKHRKLRALLESMSTATSRVPDGCWLRLLLKKTPHAKLLYAQMKSELAIPREHQPYIAWHIPSFGSTRSRHHSDSARNRIDPRQGSGHGTTERPSAHCKLLKHANTKAARAMNVLQANVFLSSRVMPVNCSRADLFGDTPVASIWSLPSLADGTDIATKSWSPVSIAAMLELFFIMDADALIHTGSSLAHLVVSANFMNCSTVSTVESASSKLWACTIPEYLISHRSGRPTTTTMATSTATEATTTARVSASGLRILPFDELLKYPTTLKADCQELVWCNSSVAVQNRIMRWQNPSPSACKSAKFLVYEPLNWGIGSTFHIAATSLAVAICTGRILYFPREKSEVVPLNKNNRWKSAGCTTSSIECYFQNITSCQLDESNFAGLPVLNDSTWTKLNDVRIVKLNESKYPSGPCNSCKNRRNFNFPLLENFPSSYIKAGFVGSETPIMAPLVRYLLRPRKWFYEAVNEIIYKEGKLLALQRPFASIHVRYGDKFIEAPRMELYTYMLSLAKRPDIKHVFVSTETDEVITALITSYPSYTFHAMKYERIGEANSGTLALEQRQQEFLYSFANLAIAVQADFFVGSLLERTRGDGGSEYWGVDVGSQYDCN